MTPEVAEAVAQQHPVVALESTIFSNLGLPDPYNREALNRVLSAVHAGGATPALTAVLDGRPWCGVTQDRHDVVCGPARKVAWRDLAVSTAGRVAYGATTVSASLAIAAATGVQTFATGGIGGVHRGWTETADTSADLTALASHRVITVCAGAKSFLDLPATLERLETLSVPVIGWRTEEFPAFYARSSGLPVPSTATTAEELAEIALAHWAFDGRGLLVVNPVPEDVAIDRSELDAWTTAALTCSGDGESSGGAQVSVSGPGVTPQVLANLVELSGGRTLAANLALAESNAAVAADISVALSTMQRTR